MSSIVKSKESVSASTTTASKSDERSEEVRFTQVETMQDVITQFFDQIVQYVIVDMIEIPPEENEVNETEIESEIKDYKDLEEEDIARSEISAASGSKVTLTKRSSGRLEKSDSKKKQKDPSSLAAIAEETRETSKASTDSSSQNLCMERERRMRITFTNECVYEGTVSKGIMDGRGRYWWTDGTIYEGDFKDGFPTGHGWMKLPDLSHYDGEFNQGVFHGKGFLNLVSTPSFYSGEFQNGQKHGQGWLLYEPGSWYEGSWFEDLKHGFGVRKYKNGAKYRGMWRQGQYDGKGSMIWENNDYYKGEWCQGLMHGEGEYVWNAFYNDVFAFPVQNIYKGSWCHGKRSGEGIMHFGDSTGIKLKGTWRQNFKHGPGYLVCGNGQVLEQSPLFHYDKFVNLERVRDSTGSFKTRRSYKMIEIPIFTPPENVDVGHYVEHILEHLENVSYEKMTLVKSFEERCIRSVIIRYLPRLQKLYRQYASIAVKTTLSYEPVMVRLFLWQFYKDKEIWKCGISLAATDDILASNPKSCLDSLHDPFEPIYFWQFLMSLIGIALTTCCLEEIIEAPQKGVSAAITKKFIEEIIFAERIDAPNSLLLMYLDLAPIKTVYAYYKKVGEPHSARDFLRKTCTPKNQEPIRCPSALCFKHSEPKYGTNLVPINQFIAFEQSKAPRPDTGIRPSYTHISDFGRLGPKNIVRCLATTCSLVVEEGLIVNIDYPLTFLEFYETLLVCMFVILELEMKREQEMLLEKCSTITPISIKSKSKGSQSFDSRKRSSRDEKKGKKHKKST